MLNDLTFFLVSALLGFELYRRTSLNTQSVEFGLGALSSVGLLVALVVAGEVVPVSLSMSEYSVFGMAPSTMLAFLAVVAGAVALSSGAMLSFRTGRTKRVTTRKN